MKTLKTLIILLFPCLIFAIQTANAQFTNNCPYSDGSTTSTDPECTCERTLTDRVRAATCSAAENIAKAECNMKQGYYQKGAVKIKPAGKTSSEGAGWCRLSYSCTVTDIKNQKELTPAKSGTFNLGDTLLNHDIYLKTITATSCITAESQSKNMCASLVKVSPVHVTITGTYTCQQMGSTKWYRYQLPGPECAYDQPATVGYYCTETSTRSLQPFKKFKKIEKKREIKRIKQDEQ